MRTKKVSFFDESASEERVPLLTTSDSTAKDEKAEAVATAKEISSSSSFGDAIVELEGLSRLLVRSCQVFTVASCVSALLGSLKSGYVEDMGMLWCTVPVWLACLWFVAEIALSFVRVRRVMLDEGRRRTLSVRRARRRMQRNNKARAGQQQQQREPGDANQDGGGGGGGGGGGKEDGSDVEGPGASAGTPRSRGGRPALARVTSSRMRRHISRGLSASASASTPSPSASEDKGEDDGEGWFGSDGSIGSSGGGGGRGGGGGGGWQMGTAGPPGTPESQPRMAARPTASYSGGEDNDGDEGNKDDDYDYVKTTLFATPAELKSSSSLKKSPPSPPPPPPPPSSAQGRDPRREVQISFLLQAWLRLWATMVFSAVILAIFLTLLTLRLFGFQTVSAGWIGSPCIIALAILALHSLLLLDGSGGFGGGPVMRGGGNRLVVGLGRRPFILLTLVSAVLVVLKVDSASAGTTTAGSTWAVAVLVGKVHWGFIFFPLWVMLFLIEVVFVVSLWENHTGVSLARSLGLFVGAAKEDHSGGVDGVDDLGRPGLFCFCLNDSTGSCESNRRGWLWWRGSGAKGEYGRLGEDDSGVGRQQQRSARGGAGAAGELRRREQHRREGSAEDGTACLAYSSGGGGGGGCSGGVRRRVELSPSQRAAASSIATGLFLLTMTVISVALGTSRDQASWGVPVTFVAAAAGLTMVGAGFVSLASAYDRVLRGPLPPIVKPLPVVFSERDGGWITGPPDPPVVTVFLLGDVVLRQEDLGFGWGRGGGGRGGLGEAEGDVYWGSTC